MLNVRHTPKTVVSNVMKILNSQLIIKVVSLLSVLSRTVSNAHLTVDPSVEFVFLVSKSQTLNNVWPLPAKSVVVMNVLLGVVINVSPAS